jgi:hypothetical protein
MLEMAKHEAGGSLFPLVNVLSQRNDIIADAHIMEANRGTTHKGVRAAVEPTGTYRDYNEGVAQEQAISDPYEEPTVMLDGMSKMDSAMLRHGVNGLAQRARYDGMYMSGMLKTFVNSLFYGDRATNVKGINGIIARAYWKTLGTGYVYDTAGGDASVTQNKTSMYIISWGEDRIGLIYPRGDAMAAAGSNMTDPSMQGLGIRLKDLGEGVLLDGNNNEYPGYRSWLECHYGFVVHDQRFLRRICNISTTNIDDVDDFDFDEDMVIDALTDMPDNMNTYCYVSRKLYAQIWKRAKDKTNVFYTMAEGPFGRPVPMIGQAMIRICDQISNAEATVTS